MHNRENIPDLERHIKMASEDSLGPWEHFIIDLNLSEDRWIPILVGVACVVIFVCSFLGVW